MLVVPDHAENQISCRRSLGYRFQRIIHAAAVLGRNQNHRRPGREPEQASPHPPEANQVGRRVKHHRNHRLGQRLSFVLARRSHAAKLTHDRVKSVIHGHTHRHRRIDRCPLRFGPHPFLADLLIGWGTPAAITLAATAPSVHQRLPGTPAPACIPNHVARATPARLMTVVR